MNRIRTAATLPQEYSRGYMAGVFQKIDDAVNAIVAGRVNRGIPYTKTSSFTVQDYENIFICNGGATITVTLPTASDCRGRELSFKTIAAFTVVSASANVVPLAGGAASTAILAATAGRWARLVSNGTNWDILEAA